MSPATTQPVKTLDDIAGEDGVFAIIAMDQRNTLRRMFTAVGIEATDEDLRQSKADVARVLTPGGERDPVRPDLRRARRHAVRGARPAAAGCSWPPSRRCASRFNGEPRTHRDPELDAQWVLDQGGDANKFFAQLRADRPAPGAGEPDLVAECLDAVRQVVDDCRDGRDPVGHREPRLPAARRGRSRRQQREDAIIEAARALNELDIDLLKLEYPGSPEGCRRLASVLDRPWAVLSAGVPFDQFTEVLQVAFDEGGASGLHRGSLGLARVAGRWPGPSVRSSWTTVARPRLDTLRAVATEKARAWTTVAATA